MCVIKINIYIYILYLHNFMQVVHVMFQQPTKKDFDHFSLDSPSRGLVLLKSLTE